MKKIGLLLSAFVVAALVLSCSDIDGLNDYNAVFSFDITDYHGAGGEIVIGEPSMHGNEIHIPVEHGIHNFPLYFKGTPKFENPIDRVTGMDFEDWIVIDLVRGGESGDEPMLDDEGEYMFQTPRFYVQALSGLPREYVFVIDYTASSSAAEVYPQVDLGELPADAVAADIVTVADAPDGGTDIFVNTVDPSFPFSVRPTFSISDGALLEGNGEKVYEFAAADDSFDFEVVAKDGTVREYTLRLNVLDVVNADAANLGPSVIELTGLRNVDIEAASRGFIVEEYDFTTSREPSAPEPDPTPDPENPDEGTAASSSLLRESYQPSDTLRVYVNTFASDPFPIRLNVETAVPAGVALVGSLEDMEFADMDSTADFWLLDTVNGVARHWIVALGEYDSPTATVLAASFNYEASTVKDKVIGGTSAPAIVFDDERTVDIDPINRIISLRAVGVNKSWSNDKWTLAVSLSLELSSGAALVDMAPLYWLGNDSWKEERTFGIRAASGTVYDWKVIIRDWTGGQPAASDQCELRDVNVVEVRPYIAKIDELDPVTIDFEQHTVAFNLADDGDAYPISVAVDYSLSDYARITTQNGGRDALVFDSPETVNTVIVESEDGLSSQEWTFRLNPPQMEIGTDVTSFQITSFSSSDFAADVTAIDLDNAVIGINFNSVGAFPVTMNVRMGLSYRATCDITDESGRGALQLDGFQDKTFTVTAQNGETRRYTIRFSYMPQLRNADFEQWADNLTPLPKGVQGSPYWCSANMKVLSVNVANTTRIDGAPGQGYAAQLKTGKTIGKLASGSLFLGWFDASNPTGNMNDPTVMTFQGIPFSANKRLKGVEMDIWYHPGGGAADDGGSIVMELLRVNNPGDEIEYHGGTHARNNATAVASGRMVVGLQEGPLDTGDTVTQAVEDSTWQRIFLPLEWEGDYPEYTHLSIICASSSQGDYFKGTEGSTMKIDNIRLIYEE